MARDVYGTVDLKHVVGIRLHEDFFGHLLGYGELVIDLEAESPDGVKHRGTHSLDFPRDARRPRDELESAVDRL